MINNFLLYDAIIKFKEVLNVVRHGKSIMNNFNVHFI